MLHFWQPLILMVSHFDNLPQGKHSLGWWYLRPMSGPATISHGSAIAALRV
jgi:hypothetical protein